MKPIRMNCYFKTMKSDICRKTGCKFFGKFSGKAACHFEHPKKFIKHLQECPAVLKKRMIMKQEKKQKPYNPFATRTIKRATVGNVKCYLRAVKQNPKDVHGNEKEIGMYYNERGCISTPIYGGEIYAPSLIYFYEIGANDGSYRKETDKDKALAAFENLVKFEQRQTEIN